MTTFSGPGSYTSNSTGIWADVRVGRDANPKVTDRDLRGHTDIYGNRWRRGRRTHPHNIRVLAQFEVERLLDTHPQRHEITPAQKWALVELAEARMRQTT